MDDKIRHSERRNKVTKKRTSLGLVACAECRRMKLKCDKKIPCGSCVRRECSSICPTGKLFSRQESRFVLEEDSFRREVQDEISRLRIRNLELEDALACAHSHISKEIHPLLSKPLVQPQEYNPEVDESAKMSRTTKGSDTEEEKAFRTSAANETLYQAANATEELSPSPSLSSQSADLDVTPDSLVTQIFRGSPLNMESFVSSILTDLPERMRAWSLCDVFYDHYTIYAMPIQREELIQVYLSPMYKFLDGYCTNHNLPLSSKTFRPHRCAVPFFVFAIAAWLDLTQERYWTEADRYFQVGLSCLSMQSIFYSPEVASVQALFLLASYIELRGSTSASNPSSSWTVISIACKIAQGLGLHRDPAQWKLDETTIQCRRWLYWELTSMEVFHGLRTGCPISSRKSYVDTELPSDLGRTDAHGQPLQGFFRWKYEAARDCYFDVVEILGAANPSTYETIIELDRKVRAKELPSHLNRILIEAGNGTGLGNHVPIREFMQSWVLGVARSMVLLTIHRTHFSKSLQDPSGNPLKSPYAPSFLASYRAASWIVKSFHVSQRRFPLLLPRLWHSWTNVMSAAMVLGSIAIDAPSVPVGNTPLGELRIASSMFDEAAVLTVSPRTKNGAKIVQKILARAEEALAHQLAKDARSVQPAICIPPTNCGDDELAILGGQTRFLPQSSRQISSQPLQGFPSHSSDPASPSPGPLDDVHPSLINFLTTAPVTQVASSMMFQDMEETAFGPQLAFPFHDPGIGPPQPYNWAYDPLPIPQNQYHSGNIIYPAASGLHIFDTFENYLNPAGPPVELGSEPNALTPWQDFMKQHSLT